MTTYLSSSRTIFPSTDKEDYFVTAKQLQTNFLVTKVAGGVKLPQSENVSYHDQVNYKGEINFKNNNQDIIWSSTLETVRVTTESMLSSIQRKSKYQEQDLYTEERKMPNTPTPEFTHPLKETSEPQFQSSKDNTNDEDLLQFDLESRSISNIISNSTETNITCPLHLRPDTTTPSIAHDPQKVIQCNHNPNTDSVKKKDDCPHAHVYCAIGSLEHINQNSIGSFNNKVHAARAKFTCDQIDRQKNETLNQKNLSMYSKLNCKKKKEGRNIDHNIQTCKKVQFDSSYIQKESNHDQALLIQNHTVPNELANKSKPDFDCDAYRKKIEIKKKVIEKEKLTSETNNKLSKIDSQVEMFRPSCDAYTSRVKRNPIKYKPAEERALVGSMSSTMGTIQRPNFRDALKRVAIIIQQHIVKIEQRFDVGVAGLDNSGLFNPTMRGAFAEEKYATPRYECTVSKMPMARPGILYGKKKIKTNYEIPTTTEVYEFAHKLFKIVQLSSECSIVCLIYVERLMEVAKVPLMANTWRPIFMCGLLLASKVWQDLSSWNVEFANVYPTFALESINRLELQYLRMLKWNLYISSSLYAKYYFALRSLVEKKDFRHKYNQMVGGVNGVAATKAMEVQKKTEAMREKALLQLSRTM